MTDLGAGVEQQEVRVAAGEVVAEGETGVVTVPVMGLPSRWCVVCTGR
jgi:hypothetical protein